MEKSTESLYQRFIESTGVSTDTRSIKPGDLFFALTGPNFNGNQYAPLAIEKGASFVVIDDPDFSDISRAILVDNTLTSLQDLARHHRRQFKIPVFALTGSNGKTTTKELLNGVLSSKYKTLATQGNLNNHIGVPLTLLRLNTGTELAIIEMGANRVGDIAELCSIAEPDHGLITNIGEAHTETFGGIEGVFRGKTELFSFLERHGGKIFLNLSDQRLKPLDKKYPKAISYPDPGISFLDAEPTIRFKLDMKTITTQMVGAYNFQNMSAAIAVGRYFAVGDDLISKAIESYVPSNHRSQIIKNGDLTIVMDGYNANPTSMMLALQSFIKIPGEKSVILADMKEVEDSKEKHEMIGKYLSVQDLKTIYLVGEAMKNAYSFLPESKWFSNVDQLKNYLEEYPVRSGSILIKGSRSMRLDEALKVLES